LIVSKSKHNRNHYSNWHQSISYLIPNQ
jgi:hypothetical protein